MKKNIINFSTAFFATIFFLSAGIANATDKPSAKAASLSFQYVGKFENLPLFQLDLSNVEEDELGVVVKDIQGEILHAETLTGKFITRKYALNVEGEDLEKIQIVVTNKKTRSTNIYQITNSSYTVQNVNISRL